MPIHCTVVSPVPSWFFRNSLSCPFSYYPWQTDVGLVQQSALHEDIPATVRVLAEFYPLRHEQAERLAGVFADCDLVLCDIAPVGIAAARQARIPSVLLENFTWDWLYAGYLAHAPQLAPFMAMFRELYQQADYHIQATPVCAPGPCDLLAGPISRRACTDRATIRRRLGMKDGQRLVLVSLGGLALAGLRLRLPDDGGETLYVVAGQAQAEPGRQNLLCLPPDSDLGHPDLVAASDAVVGKVGYSTLAEVYQARVPFGYVRRHGFRESGPLVSFIQEEMAGLELAEQELADGSWADRLTALFSLEPPPLRLPNGASQCADFLVSLAEKQGCQD